LNKWPARRISFNFGGFTSEKTGHLFKIHRVWQGTSAQSLCALVRRANPIADVGFTVRGRPLRSVFKVCTVVVFDPNVWYENRYIRFLISAILNYPEVRGLWSS
jgi:hypothetical protein